MSNAFNVEMIKSFTRTTSANRVSAVQMIASGIYGTECKANAYAAFTNCKELVGVDKGTLGIYKALADMPESVWSNFAGAEAENAEGVKQANRLVRLAQAWQLCHEAKAGFQDGFTAAQAYAHKDSVADTEANTKTNTKTSTKADTKTSTKADTDGSNASKA